ncbi:hypothetical protein BDW02DRAFT_579819 [Decorospora gaudefroyi]|uniref:Uncharacterized protein n=1 Tax=Decorospora gaudefroyi TaxID=184978 RepID=A0A6A5KIB1_9PLEO|nr:hypothetical protein BDW02DRAFT_579819 [Decorospora gaudefroyi]
MPWQEKLTVGARCKPPGVMADGALAAPWGWSGWGAADVVVSHGARWPCSMYSMCAFCAIMRRPRCPGHVALLLDTDVDGSVLCQHARCPQSPAPPATVPVSSSALHLGQESTPESVIAHIQHRGQHRDGARPWDDASASASTSAPSPAPAPPSDPPICIGWPCSASARLQSVGCAAKVLSLSFRGRLRVLQSFGNYY